MARKILYNPKGLAHIYQRGYRMSGLVCMVNHYHILLKADSQETVSRFMHDFEATYSRNFNEDSGTKGHVFKPVYGLANKLREKKQREACAYLYNNPVEKELAVKAQDYRWNFLPYAESDHPFSKKLVVRSASSDMRKALKDINYLFSEGRYITYTFLKKWFSVLDPDEINQLIDYIIIKYKVVDYEEAIRLYGSYEAMLIAFNSNTGSEHDIHEDYSDNSYMPYIRLIRFLSKDYGFENPKDVIKMNEGDRRRLCEKIILEKHVSRFIAESVLRLR